MVPLHGILNGGPVTNLGNNFYIHTIHRKYSGTFMAHGKKQSKELQGKVHEYIYTVITKYTHMVNTITISVDMSCILYILYCIFL